MKLSIVTTMYYSAPYIKEFYDRINSEASKITDDYEIIFVDDGSPDSSLEEALKLQGNDNRVNVVELSRNFGHHKAIITGLEQTKGDYIFLIDVDLEEKPELLSEFWSNHKNKDNIDVFYGVQEKRKGGWFERVSGHMFYNFINFMAGYEFPKNVLVTRLMTKQYAQELVKHKESEVFLLGICMLTGFNQEPIICKKSHKGETTYTLRKKVNQSFNAITSFSSKPLTFLFYFGFIVFFLAFLFIIYLIVKKYYFGQVSEGWTGIVASIYLFGGAIIMSIGVVGIYIAKLYNEAKSRPYTIIKKIHKSLVNERTV